MSNIANLILVPSVTGVAKAPVNAVDAAIWSRNVVAQPILTSQSATATGPQRWPLKL